MRAKTGRQHWTSKWILYFCPLDFSRRRKNENILYFWTSRWTMKVKYDLNSLNLENFFIPLLIFNDVWPFKNWARSILKQEFYCLKFISENVFNRLVSQKMNFKQEREREVGVGILMISFPAKLKSAINSSKGVHFIKQIWLSWKWSDTHCLLP